MNGTSVWLKNINYRLQINSFNGYSKISPKRPLSKRQKLVFKTNDRLMQFKSIAEFSKGVHSALLSTFIKLPFVINIFVLSFLGGHCRQVLLYI